MKLHDVYVTSDPRADLETDPEWAMVTEHQLGGVAAAALTLAAERTALRRVVPERHFVLIKRAGL